MSVHSKLTCTAHAANFFPCADVMLWCMWWMLWWMWCCGGCGVVVDVVLWWMWCCGGSLSNRSQGDSLTPCVDLDDWLEHGLICLCTVIV